MHSRCTHDPLTIHSRCTHDALVVTLTMHSRCTHDALLTMHSGCTHGDTHDARTARGYVQATPRVATGIPVLDAVLAAFSEAAGVEMVVHCEGDRRGWMDGWHRGTVESWIVDCG